MGKCVQQKSRLCCKTWENIWICSANTEKLIWLSNVDAVINYKTWPPQMLACIQTFLSLILKTSTQKWRLRCWKMLSMPLFKINDQIRLMSFLSQFKKCLQETGLWTALVIILHLFTSVEAVHGDPKFYLDLVIFMQWILKVTVYVLSMDTHGTILYTLTFCEIILYYGSQRKP